MDDGKFRIRTFGEVARATEAEIAENELDVNKELGLNDHTMPIDNFPDPFITCTFVTNELIYANLYHTTTTTHHCFIWNWKTKEVSSHQAIKMDSNNQNFPYKCFYCADENEVYAFYR